MIVFGFDIGGLFDLNVLKLFSVFFVNILVVLFVLGCLIVLNILYLLLGLIERLLDVLLWCLFIVFFFILVFF